MYTTFRRSGSRVAWLALVCAMLPASVPAVAPAPVEPWLADYAPEVKAAVNAVSEERLRDHAMYLASDYLEGRDPGSRSAAKVAEYLIATHRAAGMPAAAADGGYYQPFALSGGSGGKPGPLGEVNEVILARKRGDPKPILGALGREMLPLKWSGDGEAQGEPVFAGFGISAPDNGYDDYAGLDVKGQIVLVLPGGPKGVQGPFAVGDAAVHATLKRKAETALAKGAAALLVAGDSKLDPAKPMADGDAAWPPPPGEGRLRIPVVIVSEELANATLALAKKKRATLVAAIEKALTPASSSLTGAWIELWVRAEGRPTGMGGNVCLLWKAQAPDAVEEYIVIGAHRDHVGRAREANMSRSRQSGEIHNGADDNASGTSGLLELARVIAEKKPVLRRHLLLIHFDGEERGFLGSRHYVSAPLAPIESTVAMLNMDMIGRNAAAAMLCGPEEKDRNPALQKILLKISARFGVSLPGEGMAQYMNRSDQWPFMQKGVPAIFLFGGMHPDYHTPADDPEKLNIRKMANITKLILLFGVEVASLEQRP